jgi:phospholipid transport system substrate-binding protein
MKIFKMLLVVLMMSMPLMAIGEDAIGATMKEKIDAITELLKQKDMNIEQRDKKIIEIIDPVFDFTMMGKLSLGKRTWLSISPEQKERFNSLFDKRIKASYIKKVDLYGDEGVIVKEAKKVKKSRIHLLSFIISKGEQNEVLYKFYPSKSRGWVIYDVDVLGVSIIQTYRQQFAEVLRDHNFDELLTKLKRDQE